MRMGGYSELSELHYQTNTRRTIDLGDGLVMRWSTKADAANVADLVGEGFRWLDIGDPLPEDSTPDKNEFAMSAARRLLSGKSFCMSEFDFALVEDRTRAADRNPIVACVCLHRLEAYYGSIDLTFGKPELIATDPEYRNRGLIRHLMFEMIHPESDARGDVLQFIPGIPYFYRQFGYEYCILQPVGAIIEDTGAIPPLAQGTTEPYTLRTANQTDIPFLLALSSRERLQTHAQVGLQYTRAFWQYTVHDIFEDKQHRFDGDRETRIIVDSATGADVGFAITSQLFLGPHVDALAVQEGISYFDLTLPVFRQLAAIAKERAAKEVRLRLEAREGKEEDDVQVVSSSTASEPFALSVGLHPRHPARILLGSRVTPAPPPGGYPLYTRIPSYPAFIRKVTPELERRLAQSPLSGVSGFLRCDFFRGVEGSWAKGLELVLERGTIQAVHDWEKPSPQEAMKEKVEWKKKSQEKGVPCPQVWKAEFPPLVFSHLVMGRFGIDELLNMYGDLSVSDAMGRLLLGTLFPKVDHHMDITCW